MPRWGNALVLEAPRHPALKQSTQRALCPGSSFAGLRLPRLLIELMLQRNQSRRAKLKSVELTRGLALRLQMGAEGLVRWFDLGPKPLNPKALNPQP